MTTLTGVRMTSRTQPLEPLDSEPADGWIIFLVGLLMSLGVVMVYSASVRADADPIDWSQWWNSPLRQGAFALLGLIVLLIIAGLDHRLWRWTRRRGMLPAGIVAGAALLLLVAVLIPGLGESRLGAQRAFALPGGMTFQPSEFAKVAMIVWLAAMLSRPGVPVRSLWTGYLPAIGTAGILIALTGLEDFGTAALMGLVAFVMLMMAGARATHLGATAVLGLGAASILVFSKEYRIRRLLSFLSEAPDPAREGYQLSQALIAIGSGGWWGRGLGNGVQKYGYVPHDENDFIFAIICEELGVAGGIVVCALFMALLWRGFIVVRRSPDDYTRLLAGGLTMVICLQAAINIAVVTGAVPTKGISLPFVSAGGSGLMFLCLAAGLLAACGRVEPATRSG